MKQQLQIDFLKVLHNSTRKEGLTFAQMARKCGSDLSGAIDLYLGKRAKGASASQKIKELAYDLWSDGLDVVVPPKGRQNAPRLQHPEYIKKRRLSKGREKSSNNGVGDELVALKKAYNKFLPQHPSGAVNIYKIRRDLGWERSRFDHLMSELSARKNPPFQFVGGDPHDFSSNKRKDSVFQDGQYYFSILWRS